MLLKELREGQKFEFVDKNTDLISVAGDSIPAKGAFVYQGVSLNVCPILLSNANGLVFTGAAGTYRRDVCITL